MNIPYIIVPTDKLENFEMQKLDEAVRNTFVSKNIQNSSIIICVQNGDGSKDIFDDINSIIKDEINFLVIPFNSFFGSLDAATWDWMKKCFPESGITTIE